jgi:peptidoglycan/LPS O-acetylase OafA/YrhL
VSVKQTSTKIAPLTATRFFAALYVVLFHTVNASGFVLPLWSLPILGFGRASVTFFFVLSGYILALVYLGRPVLDRKRFWIARFARVYPLFLVTLVLDLPQILMARAAIYGWHASLWKTSLNFLLDLFMLQGWSEKNGINVPNWSLSDETFFYALFPFLGVLIWKLRTRTALIVGIALYLGTIAMDLLLHRHGVRDMYAYSLPLQRATEFLIGIVACKLHVYVLSSEARRNLLHRISLPLALACAALFVLCCFATLPLPITVVNGIFLVPLYVALIMALASNPPFLGRIFSAPALVILGEASFALYLLHAPLWHAFEILHLKGGRIHYIAYLALAIGLSVCSFLYFEGPARKKILTWFAERDPEGTQLSSMAQ